MPWWDEPNSKGFDPEKADSIYTQDSEGRRATRVIMAPASGSMTGSYVDGALKTYEQSTLNTTNDSVRAEDIPPPEIVTGGVVTTSATIGNSTQLTATTATIKRGVWIRHDPFTVAPEDCVQIIGASYDSTNHAIISGSNPPVPLKGRFIRKTSALSGSLCEEMFLPIDDPSKVYVCANSASIKLVWQAI